jgi:hypothetical protein
VLHTEHPVPDVGRRQIAVHGHDGAGTVETVHGGATVDWALVPWNSRRIKEEGQGNVSRGDGATGGIAARVNGRAGRNTARTEGVVEGDKRLPVHRFVNQTYAASKHG